MGLRFLGLRFLGPRFLGMRFLGARRFAARSGGEYGPGRQQRAACQQSHSMSSDPSPQPSNAQWGGRFASAPAEIMQLINASIGFDHRLWRQDIAGSRAHAAMLAHVGIISKADRDAIDAGLAGIADEIEAGRFGFDDALEDIHMNIEARLAERIGDAGRRLPHPRAAATTRWPRISACGCAMRSTGWTASWPP